MADKQLEVLVAPLSAPEDAAQGPCSPWNEPFDVLLHWQPQGDDDDNGGGRVLTLERSLRDFAAFARDLRAQRPPDGLPAAFHWEQLASQSEEEVPSSLLTPHTCRQRLRYALEAFVTEQLARSPLPLAVLRFVAPNVCRLTYSGDWEATRQRYRQAVDEALAAAAASTDSPLPPLGTPAASAASSAWEEPSSLVSGRREPQLLLRDEWVAAGCSLEHEVVIHVGDGDRATSKRSALVVWRFASQREQLKFAVDFSASNVALPGYSDTHGDVSDPYSAAGFSAAYEVDADEASKSTRDAEWQVVRYRSTMDFPENLTHDANSFVYGHWTATGPGTLRLTWENADMHCVLSKQLQFQIAVLPFAESDVVSSEVVTQAERLDAIEDSFAPEADGRTGNVTLLDLLRTATKNVADELPDWCQVDGEQSITEDDTRDSLAASDCADTFNSGTYNRSQQRGLVDDAQRHRISHLEVKVAELERSLASTKHELREARDQTEIANEIYKASLETITRLEHDAVVQKRSQSQSEVSAQAASAVCSTTSASTERGVDEGEHERVKSLCASFQEQCLWRSIETAESEKRNLQLEAKLNEALKKAQAMSEQFEATKRELAAMKEETRKLKAHRTLLAEEVKRLQPYSQVNLTALVQEAQEARMMQRSLQVQLDCLRGSGDGPFGAVESTSDDGGASEDGADAAAGGFVVLSSSRRDE